MDPAAQGALATLTTTFSRISTTSPFASSASPSPSLSSLDNDSPSMDALTLPTTTDCQPHDPNSTLAQRPQQRRKSRKAICEHRRRKTQCVLCYDNGTGGGSICPHRKRKDGCHVCRGLPKRPRMRSSGRKDEGVLEKQATTVFSTPSSATRNSEQPPTSGAGMELLLKAVEWEGVSTTDKVVKQEKLSASTPRFNPFSIEAILGRGNEISASTSSPPVSPPSLFYSAASVVLESSYPQLQQQRLPSIHEVLRPSTPAASFPNNTFTVPFPSCGTIMAPILGNFHHKRTPSRLESPPVSPPRPLPLSMVVGMPAQG